MLFNNLLFILFNPARIRRLPLLSSDALAGHESKPRMELSGKLVEESEMKVC